MPGIGLVIEGAMQHAPQSGRQASGGVSTGLGVAAAGPTYGMISTYS
jgi:hypothetical protein